MVVVDASIVVRLLLNRRADVRLRAHFSGFRELHAPTLIDAEVTSAIRGLLRASGPDGPLTPSRAGDMITDYGQLPLLRYPMAPYQRRVLELRHNYTAYDAFYIALAESLDVTLLTADRKFHGAPGSAAAIATWPDVS